MSDATTTESSTRWGELIELQPAQLVQIVVVGLVIGVAQWLVALAVHHALLAPLFCGDPSTAMCVNAPSTADAIATIIVAIIGLMGLVRLGVYRPLPIVVAAAVSLWGIGTWTMGMPWFESLAWTIILYGICYALFTWLVRPRSFAIAMILVIVAVLLARFIPML